jgi:hypothetical protein
LVRVQLMKPQELPGLQRSRGTSKEQKAMKKKQTEHRSWLSLYLQLPPQEHAHVLQPCAAASISICSLAQQQLESKASHP